MYLRDIQTMTQNCSQIYYLCCNVTATGTQTQQRYQTFSSPTNAHVEFIKTISIKKAAPTRFGLQGNHHQGACQRLAKITHLVHVDT